MKCYSCGAEYEENSRFCAFCGANLSERPAEVTEEATAVEETVAEANVVEEVVAEQPMAEAVETAETVVETPVAQAPVVENQVPETPVAEPTVEETPVAAVPVAQAPVQPQAAERPVVQQVVVQQPVAQQMAWNLRPVLQLPTNRGMLKYFLLGLVTFMIYPMVIMSQISMEINMVASRYDGKRTMHYLWMTMLMPLTLGIILLVWIHNLCGRMGGELKRRGITYKFSAASYWLWNIVWPVAFSAGAGIVAAILVMVKLQAGLIILISSALAVAASVGMFMFFHKFFKAMNLINADYNQKG